MTTNTSPNASPTAAWDDASAESLAHEHARLLELADVLSAAAGSEILLRTLEAMRPPLVAHFAEEERAGGFYDDVLQARPWLAARVRGLQGQHVALTRALDELLSGLTEAPSPIEPHEAARDALVALLRRHESDESELVGEAWWRDLGEGD